MNKSKAKSLIIKAVSNKFTLTFVVFILWLSFFDQHSIWERKKHERKIESLSKEKDYFWVKIEKDKNRINELKTNKVNLEKFAREQYLMKKENEDIFIIINKE